MDGSKKVMLVAKHKRSKDRPAILAMNEELMDVFVNKIRPQVAPKDKPKLFLQLKGTPYVEGTIGKRLSEFWMKSGVNEERRVAHTDLRKFIATTTHEKAPEKVCSASWVTVARHSGMSENLAQRLAQRHSMSSKKSVPKEKNQIRNLKRWMTPKKRNRKRGMTLIRTPQRKCSHRQTMIRGVHQHRRSSRQREKIRHWKARQQRKGRSHSC